MSLEARYEAGQRIEFDTPEEARQALAEFRELVGDAVTLEGCEVVFTRACVVRLAPLFQSAPVAGQARPSSSPVARRPFPTLEDDPCLE